MSDDITKYDIERWIDNSKDGVKGYDRTVSGKWLSVQKHFAFKDESLTGRRRGPLHRCNCTLEVIHRSLQSPSITINVEPATFNLLRAAELTEVATFTSNVLPCKVFTFSTKLEEDAAIV